MTPCTTQSRTYDSLHPTVKFWKGDANSNDTFMPQKSKSCTTVGLTKRLCRAKERLWTFDVKAIKVSSYIARYPVLRTAQSALHFTSWPTCSIQGHFNFSGKHSATLQLLRKDYYSFTYPTLSVLPGANLYGCVNCGNVE